MAGSDAISVTRRRAYGLTGFALLAGFAGNLAVVVGLWWRGGGLSDVHRLGALLTSGGRLAGLLGAYLILVQVLLLARIPALERAVGFDRLTGWHRINGRVAIVLLLAHAALITAGYALTDRISLPREEWSLLTTFPGILTATAGLAALVGVVI